MGTRSTTRIIDESGNCLVNMYRQYDGYPSGHGRELHTFLTKYKLVNGIPGGADKTKLANGAGCLAALMVRDFKVEAGGFYLAPADQHDEEYNYLVEVNDEGDMLVSVNGSAEMTLDQFDAFCEKED